MKYALIIGRSGGIGAAISHELTTGGWTVHGVSRCEDGFDLTQPQTVDAKLDALPGPYDLILIATGALEIDGNAPEKTIKSINASAMAQQFAVNAIGPALILRHAARLLPKDRDSVIAVLSARVGSIGDNALGGWVSYRAAKAALNQIVKTTSIELARSHPKTACITLHPGTVETQFTQAYSARYPSVSPEVAAKRLLTVCEKIKPAQTGGFYDYNGNSIPW